MNTTFSASKKIAKQIKIVSYRAELQLYELQVTWQDDCDSTPSVLFLPQHFIYPYAVEKKKVNQTVQISAEIKRKTQKEALFTKEIDKSAKQVQQSRTLSISRGIRKSQIKTTEQLNFDQLTELNSTKSYFTALKKQILKVKQKMGKKKRKC